MTKHEPVAGLATDSTDRRQMLRQAGLLAFCSFLTGCGGSPRTSTTPPSMAIEPGQRIAYGQDPLQFGDLRVPSGGDSQPVVVVVHGGFWRSQYGLDLMSALSAALTADGWATWNIEYRRLGDPGGGWPGTFLDVAQATDHLRQLAGSYRLDLSRVTALGHSAGGHLALWLAGRSRIPAGGPLHATDPLRIRQIVCLAGVADLRQAWQLRLGGGVVQSLVGGTPEEVPDRYASASPAALLPLGLAVRQVLVHGGRDTIVPPEISRSYQQTALARGDNAILIELPDAGHFEVIDPRDKAWERIRQALARDK
jgi:acetyl esterase/lipase